MRLFWVPGHSEIIRNKIVDVLTRKGTVHQFAGLERSFGVSRQNTGRMIKHWIDNQHPAMWRGLTSTQKWAQNLITGPGPTTKLSYCPFNMMQSRIVTSFLTRCNILWRHLYIMELTNSPLCRKCGAEVETSVHTLCECEALATLRHTYFGSFFLDPEDVRCLRPGAIWNFIKEMGLP